MPTRHRNPDGYNFDVEDIAPEVLSDLLDGPLARAKGQTLTQRQIALLACLCPCGPLSSAAKGAQPDTDRRRRLAYDLQRELVTVHAYWVRCTNEASVNGNTAAATNSDRARHAVETMLSSIIAGQIYLRTDEAPVWTESWESAAFDLFRVWTEAARFALVRKPDAISETGPSLTFVISAMRCLGWATHVYPSRGAVLKFLQRTKPSLDKWREGSLSRDVD